MGFYVVAVLGYEALLQKILRLAQNPGDVLWLWHQFYAFHKVLFRKSYGTQFYAFHNLEHRFGDLYNHGEKCLEPFVTLHKQDTQKTHSFVIIVPMQRDNVLENYPKVVQVVRQSSS